MIKKLCVTAGIILLMSVRPSLADGPVRIGLTLSLTGSYSEMGDMQSKGYRLWVDQVNSRGGILGRPVEIVLRDDGSDGARAATLYEELILKERVDLIFGPYSSGITNAILPVAARHGYPLLVGGASADRLWQQGYQNVFGVYIPASRYAVGFLEMLVMSGLGDVAVLSADDPFSQSIAEGSVKWAHRYGLNIVFNESFPKGQEDFQDVLTRARQAGARVIFVCGHFQESVLLRGALAGMQWEPAAFYASVGPVLDQYREQMGDKAERTFSSSQWEPHPDLAFPGSRAFLDSFVATYGESPSYHAATAFAAGTILEDAVGKTGVMDRQRIKEVLGTLDTMSIIGRYGVDRTGMQIRQFPVIIQWQKGRKEIVWPSELRTAAPVFR
ncbi:MAG: amino acid ABC transporter substrate-binding protein [bacterium]|nr:MAG: amino acid ABC transporter substrate-binding protein [bacterium]